jgi:hypothetical protein
MIADAERWVLAAPGRSAIGYLSSPEAAGWRPLAEALDGTHCIRKTHVSDTQVDQTGASQHFRTFEDLAQHIDVSKVSGLTASEERRELAGCELEPCEYWSDCAGCRWQYRRRVEHDVDQQGLHVRYEHSRKVPLDLHRVNSPLGCTTQLHELRGQMIYCG